jgi:hypothetical protein
VPAPDGPAYFTSRGSVLGQVPGTVVAAAFGVFNPEVVVPAVAFGWTKTDAATICQAARRRRRRPARADPRPEPRASSGPTSCWRAPSSRCARGPQPVRRPGSLRLPPTTLGQVWRRGDMLREFRGDSHIAAWIGAGSTPPRSAC